jgi:branched-chain amino acid transport system substrate-binding protein
MLSYAFRDSYVQQHKEVLMKQVLRAAVLAATLVMAAPSVYAQAPIRIGFVGELSGPQGALGQDQYDAFMMLVEANGGKLGGVPVQIFKEDSQLKPDVATQVVDKLLEKDKVQIITGVTFSNIMMTVHKKITDKGVFLIGSNAGPSPIAGAACSPYQFITSWQNDNQAEVVGQFAVNKGYKNVVGMAPNYQAGKDFIAGFKRYYKGNLADEIYTSLTQVDYSAELAQVAAKNPDAIYIFYPGGLGVNFMKQFAQSGLKGKVAILSTSTVDGTTLPGMQEAGLGAYSGTFWAPDFANPTSQKFVADFEAKYKRIPSQYAAQSFDAAQLLDSAIAKVKGNVDDKKAFQAALKAADFKSLRGKFKFGDNHFPVQDMFIFEAYKDSKNRMNLRTVTKALDAHVDAYAPLCKMKAL